jgi:hypothetical protein
VRLEGLGKLKESNDIIGNRTRDLPACSIVSQSTTLPRVQVFSQISLELAILAPHNHNRRIHSKELENKKQNFNKEFAGFSSKYCVPWSHLEESYS